MRHREPVLTGLGRARAHRRRPLRQPGRRYIPDAVSTRPAPFRLRFGRRNTAARRLSRGSRHQEPRRAAVAGALAGAKGCSQLIKNVAERAVLQKPARFGFDFCGRLPLGFVPRRRETGARPTGRTPSKGKPLKRNRLGVRAGSPDTTTLMRAIATRAPSSTLMGGICDLTRGRDLVNKRWPEYGLQRSDLRWADPGCRVPSATRRKAGRPGATDLSQRTTTDPAVRRREAPVRTRRPAGPPANQIRGIPVDRWPDRIGRTNRSPYRRRNPAPRTTLGPGLGNRSAPRLPRPDWRKRRRRTAQRNFARLDRWDVVGRPGAATSLRRAGAVDGITKSAGKLGKRPRRRTVPGIRWPLSASYKPSADPGAVLTGPRVGWLPSVVGRLRRLRGNLGGLWPQGVAQWLRVSVNLGRHLPRRFQSPRAPGRVGGRSPRNPSPTRLEAVGKSAPIAARSGNPLHRPCVQKRRLFEKRHRSSG